MDTVLLFALPLVGGLIFCDAWNLTRYRAAREEGHRLYFRAVLYGSVLFALIFSIRACLDAYWPAYADIDASLRRVIKPMAKDTASADAVAALTLVCFVSMLVAWPIAKVLNIFFGKKWSLERAVSKDEFEHLLYRSIQEQFPVEVTASDGKVYVGYVVSSFDPRIPRKTFSILPLISGYRNSETRKVHFTTYYTKIYKSASPDQHLEGPLAHLRPEHFVTILPVDNVVSSRRFDFKAYDAFNEPEPSDVSQVEDEQTG